MKVLHLASFVGNIGDGANHSGFYSNFRKHITQDVTFEQCEIRDFYKSWNLKHFDEDFIRQVNSYDLLVIGGGNFLEICWDYSATATTIDIPPELFEKIEIPVFFNGIGFDDTKGATPENIEKFRRFFGYLMGKDSVAFSVRNDGSRFLMEKYFTPAELERVQVVPDGGFFYKIEGDYSGVPDSGCVIGMCLASDMKNTRFAGANTYADLVDAIAKLCTNIVARHPQAQFIFVPHIFLDYEVIAEVVSRIPDPIRRRHITISHLKTLCVEDCFAAYSKCDLVLSLRFHGNVVPMANGIPTIGVTTLPKHGYLYDELGLSDRAISVGDPDLSEKLDAMVEAGLAGKAQIQALYREVNQKNARQIEAYYGQLRSWLNRDG